jgi:hypothetical protein
MAISVASIFFPPLSERALLRIRDPTDRLLVSLADCLAPPLQHNASKLQIVFGNHRALLFSRSNSTRPQQIGPWPKSKWNGIDELAANCRLLI